MTDHGHRGSFWGDRKVWNWVEVVVDNRDEQNSLFPSLRTVTGDSVIG